MTKPILAAMLSCKTTSLTDEEKYLFEKYSPLGITLFARNIKSTKQVKSLIEEIKNTINREDVLIAIDEEGGRVSRLKKIKKTQYASAHILGQYPLSYSVSHAKLISTDMNKLGININYSPVTDVEPQNNTGVLEGRCFGKDKNIIKKYVTSMADTYIDMGICPCLKHIPGHFESTKDPHLNTLETDLSLEDITKEIEYLRFISNYPMAMTSHIKLNAIDNDYPLTVSQKSISTIIRGILDFDGFLISDAIDMHAVSGKIKEKTKLSLEAGVDAICYCSGKMEHLTAICEEKRFMNEKSLIRFANIKKVIHNTPKPIDIKAVQNFYQEGLKDVIRTKYSYDATEVLHKMQKKGVMQ